MNIFSPNNPGISGIDELTDGEAFFLQGLVNLPYANGDILYYNNGFKRLPKGTDTQVLTLASGLPSWATPAGGGGSGTVTSVSVVSANGFAGTVATPTTTPAITLTTSITGLLKGNGTAISTAAAGTDYLAPFTSQTAKTFFAAPNGAAGVPTFRLIVASDIPTLNQNTTGTAANITATSNTTLTTLSNLAITQTQVTGLTTALSGKEGTIAAGTTSQYWRGDKSWQTLDKTAVGLANVDNTSDATKNSATVTLTNKRITRRVSTEASNATPSINTDNFDMYRASALAVAITGFTITGTPTDGQTLWVSLTDNGTARAITWGTSFEASTVALPTTTVASARLDVGFVWNTVTSKWRCVAVA